MQFRFHLILLLVFLSGFLGATPKDSVKTYLWGLIKIKSGQGLDYEDGYVYDRIFHPREFNESITFIPLEVSYGLGLNGGGGEDLDLMKTGWIRFEENPPYTFDGGSWSNRFGHQLELDFLKTNLSHYILKTSWADMHTGINFRYSSIFWPSSIPNTEWTNFNPSWDAPNTAFSPRLFTVGLSHSWIIQRSQRWYLTFKYTYGVAFADFYQSQATKQYEPTPSGWGPSTSYTAGYRWVFDPGMTNRYAVGFDVKHIYTKIDRISDSNNLTPVSRFDLANYGLYLTINVFYGGRKTSGDKGKEYYFHRDYVKAVKHLNAFLLEHPTHSNRYKAEALLRESERKIPHQFMREGLSYDERNMPDKALDRYLRARVVATDSVMLAVLNFRIDQIADKHVYDAELLLEKGDSKKALSVVENVATYSNKARELLPRFRARVLLRDGEIAMEAGVYKKALHLFAQAMRKSPDLNIEIGLLQHQIAVKLVEQANSIEDQDAILLAIESLEIAEKLSPAFRESDKMVLIQLKNALKEFEAQQQQILINERMKKVRQELEKQRRPSAEVGMTIPEVQAILGEPREKVHRPNVEGEDHQLWLYPMVDEKELQITFFDFIVIRIEVR